MRIRKTTAEDERRVAGELNRAWREQHNMGKSLIDILRGAGDEVTRTTEVVVTAMRADTKVVQRSSDYGEQVAASIEVYGQQVADFIAAIGDQLVATAESYKGESRALADNIRRCAEMEAARAREFTHRMREAGIAMRQVKQAFDQTVKSNGPSPTPVVDMQQLEKSIAAPVPAGAAREARDDRG
jgi:hypothetical protein